MCNSMVAVVLNYNDTQTTTGFLKFAKDNEEINHIVVVDNASTDNSFERLYQYKSEKIDVIRSESNRGYACGNNFGVSYAIRKYDPFSILICNPDIVFDEKGIRFLKEVLVNKDKCGIVSLAMDSKSEIKYKVAWKLPKYGDVLLSYCMMLKKIVGDRTEYKETYLEGDIVNVDVLPGSMFAIKASVFADVGGFCEKTFLYNEENLLAARLLEKGYQNYLLPKSTYTHNHGISINKSIPNVKKRLALSFESSVVYAEEVLHVGRVKKQIMKIVNSIGTFNYIVGIQLLNIKR